MKRIKRFLKEASPLLFAAVLMGMASGALTALAVFLGIYWIAAYMAIYAVGCSVCVGMFVSSGKDPREPVEVDLTHDELLELMQTADESAL